MKKYLVLLVAICCLAMLVSTAFAEEAEETECGPEDIQIALNGCHEYNPDSVMSQCSVTVEGLVKTVNYRCDLFPQEEPEVKKVVPPPYVNPDPYVMACDAPCGSEFLFSDIMNPKENQIFEVFSLQDKLIPKWNNGSYIDDHQMEKQVHYLVSKLPDLKLICNSRKVIEPVVFGDAFLLFYENGGCFPILSSTEDYKEEDWNPSLIPPFKIQKIFSCQGNPLTKKK
ncbi:MAG: hypothetical protein KBG38_05440 [Candidatus Cloacimonas sp.]|nr:hypothetical protein [Candidatus Cloacimonas sp.]